MSSLSGSSGFLMLSTMARMGLCTRLEKADGSMCHVLRRLAAAQARTERERQPGAQVQCTTYLTARWSLLPPWSVGAL